MKKIKKILKKNYKLCFGIILGITLSSISVYAVNIINSKDVLYSNANSSLSSIDVQDAIDELSQKAKMYCPEGYKCIKKFEVGDYVKMTPTSTSFTTDTKYTGYSSSQTINPSELNLWRIIKINDDGTIEMISEYVSSVNIIFYGKTGYLNYVGYLNTIAKQYENSKYTVGSRMIGYNGQTEYITDASKITTTAPWLYDTKDNSNESLGGGDILYETDLNLVKDALGTVSTSKVGDSTKESKFYYLASRFYDYSDNNNYALQVRFVNMEGEVHYPLYYHGINGFGDNQGNPPTYIRPIVILKAGLIPNGSGTSDDPYILY